MSATGELRHVTRSLRLSTPSGDDLPTETVWFAAGDGDRMRVLLSWTQWERVAREQLFALDESDIPSDLIPDTDVVIDTECRPDAKTGLPDDEPSLRRRLADPNEPLRETDSWAVTAVHQQVPIPDEVVLTDSVFAEASAPRTHATSLEFVQHSPSGRTESTETAAVDDGLVSVVRALDTAGWPYDVAAEGSRLSLVATVDDHEWPVHIQPGNRDGWWTIRSVHPTAVRDAERGALAEQLLTYTAERGSFELDSETGTVAFRTPFVPANESVTDTVGENVTAMAEWLESIERCSPE